MRLQNLKDGHNFGRSQRNTDTEPPMERNKYQTSWNEEYNVSEKKKNTEENKEDGWFESEEFERKVADFYNEKAANILVDSVRQFFSNYY